EGRHVATDLAESSQRDDAERAFCKRFGSGNRNGHSCLLSRTQKVPVHGRAARPSSQRVVPCTFGRAPPAAALRSGRKFEKSAPGTSLTSASSSSMIAASHSSGPTRGSRTRGLEIRPRPCRIYFTATVPGTCVI